MDRIRKADPWFFPSEKWMQQTLEHAGFQVAKVEIEYRPTKLNPDAADGSGGLQGWVSLMTAPFLDVLENDEEKSIAVGHVCEVLEDVIQRQEDGSKWLGYVRLRAIARRPD